MRSRGLMLLCSCLALVALPGSAAAGAKGAKRTRDTVAPSIVVSVPTTGASITGTVTVAGSASDNTGVSQGSGECGRRLVPSGHGYLSVEPRARHFGLRGRVACHYGQGHGRRGERNGRDGAGPGLERTTPAAPSVVSAF